MGASEKETRILVGMPRVVSAAPAVTGEAFGVGGQEGPTNGLCDANPITIGIGGRAYYENDAAGFVPPNVV